MNRNSVTLNLYFFKIKIGMSIPILKLAKSDPILKSCDSRTLVWLGHKLLEHEVWPKGIEQKRSNQFYLDCDWRKGVNCVASYIHPSSDINPTFFPVCFPIGR